LVSRAASPKFFFPNCKFFDLAPSRELTKFEAPMTTSMDELAKKFDGFDAALTKVLDKLSGLAYS